MSGLNQQELINNLSWTVERNCDSEDEITVFRIYFSEFEDSALDFIAEVDGQDRVFSHQSNDGISGCYVVTTLDELGNESPVSNKVCLDNCPLYDLPNTFTPNDDQANDLFTPRINRFIERVELEIYNKWGQVVFKTEDPQINWDGRNEGGKELAQGAYYYKARVFERRLSGIFEQDDIRVGYINLIR
jgi:gliding motility-associated-like protein